MIDHATTEAYEATLAEIRAAGLFKQERSLQSPQGPRVTIDGRSYLNLCTNDYLGLAASPAVVAAAHAALDRDGFGMASVRFISGTHEEHRALEAELTSWLGTDDTILFPSCFDANGGVFETLLEAEDAVISDELNHASIIDGVRLSKAQRYRYTNRDMVDLDAQLTAARAAGARRMLVVTDGVFSMDGYIAPLGRALRGRREARRAGDGRRLACRRHPGRDRRRNPRAVRGARPRRPGVGHARQGARGSVGRIRLGTRTADRAAASAGAAVPVLERRAADGGGGIAGGARGCARRGRRAGPPRRERGPVPRRRWPKRDSSCCPASTRSCR